MNTKLIEGDVPFIFPLALMVLLACIFAYFYQKGGWIRNFVFVLASIVLVLLVLFIDVKITVHEGGGFGLF